MWKYLSLVFLLFVALPGRAETYLLMAEEDGCYWCGQWNNDIAQIYPKTTEGRAAPLRRFDIHDAPPADVTFKSRVRFTPTFILVRDGQEVGRIEGYPGEDFFWGLLSMIMDEAGVHYRPNG